MREEGKDLDSLLILTKDNLKAVLNTPYVKNSRVAAFCERCNKKFVTKPKTIAESGFLCKGCKIAFTKQNTDLETLKVQNKKKSESMKKLFSEKGESIKEKRKQTMLERYGVEFIAQSEAGLEKIKNTKKQKYGDDYNKQITDKTRKTTLEKYGKAFATQIDQFKEKSRQTCLEKYGTEYSFQSENNKSKSKKTLLEKYGVENAAQSNQAREKLSLARQNVSFEEMRAIRSKSTSKYVYKKEKFDSKWELALWIYAEDHNEEIEKEPCCFEYEFKGKKHKYVPDFRYKGKLLEIKGDQFFDKNGKMINPFCRKMDELYEAKHQCGIKNNVTFWKKDDLQFVLDYIKEKYTLDYLDLFKANLPFPYPNQDLSDTSDYGIIKHFHRSIFKATKKDSLSPLQAWQDKNLVRLSALNRLKYIGDCKPEHVVGGFSVARIAPKISVFKPTLATNLIKKYLNDFSEIVDPFSGFSGRLIGAKNCNKTYVGKDINEEHVKESNEIIQYKNYPNCLVSVEDLLKKENVESYECLFTCPPYDGKEHWNKNNDEVEKSCDEWIDLCLAHYKCKRYLFVVDETEKYKDKIVEELENKNGLFKRKNSELVILIDC